MNLRYFESESCNIDYDIHYTLRDFWNFDTSVNLKKM